jgi:hypothetical protein
MKKNILMMITLLAATTAFAGGVEKHYVLPADATNVKVEEVTVTQELTSQTLIADGNDGPVYENNYTPMLEVKVTYDSKDHSDDQTALGNGNDPIEEVIGGPAVYFTLPATDAELAAVEAGKLSGTSLVSLVLVKQNVSFNDDKFGDDCTFSADQAAPLNPECIIHDRTVENRPIVSISRK